MWSVRINNFDKIVYDKTKLFYSYYCRIRVLFRRIFTKFILYLLTQLEPIDKLNDCNIVNTEVNDVKLLNSVSEIVPKASNENDYKEQIQFLMLATQVINSNYTGDPSGLMSFLNSIELLENVATSQENILRLFILSKVEGRALQAVSVSQNTIKEIKDSLKVNIRYDQSNLISAKIKALPYEKLSLLQFIDQCKTLALDYQRSLIDEGFTRSLANEETISKCLEICLTRARSNSTKLILHAASFNNIQDLLSKFLSSEIREKTNSKYSLTFNSHNNYKRNQNYNNRFKNYHFENNKLQSLDKRNYPNIYSHNQNNFQYNTQHYKRFNTISRNANNNRNLNYCFNRYNNYNSKKLCSDKTNNCDSTGDLFCELNTKSDINPHIYHEHDFSQTNNQQKKERYFHENKNVVTPTLNARKTYPFYNKCSRNTPQYGNKTNYQLNNNSKHNHSSSFVKNGTNDVITTSDVENSFTCSSPTYSLNNFRQQRNDNPYFKTMMSEDTVKQVSICHGNNMKENTNYKGNSSLINSSIPSHDPKSSYNRSSLTNSKWRNTYNVNKSASQNYVYFKRPFYRNSYSRNACSDSKIKFDNKREINKLNEQDISNAEIEDLGAEWP